MKYDVCFLKKVNGLSEVPLTVTGKATDNEIIVQQFITLLYATEGPLREFGGNLSTAIYGSNIDGDFLLEVVNDAALNTSSYLLSEGVPINSVVVNNIDIELDSAKIYMTLVIGDDEIEISLTTPIDQDEQND